MNDACARWIALSDRRAVGEALQEPELAFLRKHVEGCAHCTAESAVWDDLAGMLEADLPEATPHEAPIARRRPRARYVAAAFAVAAAGALAFVRWREPPSDTYQARVAGPLEVDGKLLRDGTSVRAGTTLHARTDRACLHVEPGVRACLEPDSVVRVVGLGAERRLALQKGKVVAELDPQPAGTSFGVLTRDSSAVAIGTAFSVELSPTGATITRVLHGTVVVHSGGHEHRLTAGRMVESGGEPSAIETPSAQPAEQPRPEPTRQPVADPAPAPAAQIVPHARSEPRTTATELLARARERRASGDVDGALGAYERLLQQQSASAEAHASLVPYAELLLTNGRADDALRAFERYLARPGALAEEAAFGRLRALRALAATDREQAAIARFLRDYPDSPLASGLRARLRGAP